jgi:predicted PurR-regulated permease PerM
MAEEIPSPAPDAQRQATPTEPDRTLTGLAISAAIIAALYFAKEVLLPVTLAVLLSFVLSPLVRVLRKLRIPRVVAVVFSVGLALAIIGGIAALVGAEMVHVARDLPKYQHTIEQKVAQIRSATVDRIFQLSTRFHRAVGQTNSQSPKAASGDGDQAAARQPSSAPALPQAQQILLPVLSPLLTAAIIFVVAVFILMQQQDLRDRIIRLFGARERQQRFLRSKLVRHPSSRFVQLLLARNSMKLPRSFLHNCSKDKVCKPRFWRRMRSRVRR